MKKKQQTCIVGNDNLHKEVNSHQTSSGNPHLINSSSKYNFKELKQTITIKEKPKILSQG